MADIRNAATRPVLCPVSGEKTQTALPCMAQCCSPGVATQQRTGPRIIVCTTAITLNVGDMLVSLRAAAVPLQLVVAMQTQICIGHACPLDTLESLAQAYCSCSAHARMPFAPVLMRQVAPRCTAVDKACSGTVSSRGANLPSPAANVVSCPKASQYSAQLWTMPKNESARLHRCGSGALVPTACRYLVVK